MRGRTQLNSGTAEGLFYASFELRAGIQARMQEYLHAQDSVAKHRKEDWRLNKLGQSLDEVFHIENRIAAVAFHKIETGELLAELYYTPVTSQLQKEGTAWRIAACHAEIKEFR